MQDELADNLDDMFISFIKWYEPTLINHEPFGDATPIKVETYNMRHMILLDNGDLYGIGWNSFSIFGTAYPESGEFIDPVRVELDNTEGASGSRVIDFKVGNYHFCAVHENGALSCQGWDHYGMVSIANRFDGSTDRKSAKLFGVGNSETCVVSKDNYITCVGMSTGNGQNKVNSPYTFDKFYSESYDVIEFEMGGSSNNHACARLDREVDGTGSNVMCLREGHQSSVEGSVSRDKVNKHTPHKPSRRPKT